jgi:hypothetical protein
MTTPSNDSLTVFAALNQTELYQLCRGAGLPVRPDATREHIIRTLEGLEPPMEEAEHPIDQYRLALIGFVKANWERIQTQITCPMRELPTNPRPCFGCPDSRVIACMVDNRNNADKIVKYKPQRNK